MASRSILIEHPVKRAALEAEQTACGVWKLVRRQPSSANFCTWGVDAPPRRRLRRKKQIPINN